MEIQVVEKILQANDLLAGEVREILGANGVASFNIMGTPGSGKTSIIEQTFSRLRDEFGVAVIEGDIATSLDAERLSRLGLQVVQVNTGGECHLDAGMVKTALPKLDLSAVDLLLIENVGNLVCPAEFDIGESKKILITSTPEGDDKCQKYPLMFRLADAVVVNKVDLMPYVEFNRTNCLLSLSNLNPQAPVFEVSCTTGEGLDEWAAWVRTQLGKRKSKT